MVAEGKQIGAEIQGPCNITGPEETIVRILMVCWWDTSEVTCQAGVEQKVNRLSEVLFFCSHAAS